MSGVGSSRLSPRRFCSLDETAARLFTPELYKASFHQLVHEVVTAISRPIDSATMQYLHILGRAGIVNRGYRFCGHDYQGTEISSGR